MNVSVATYVWESKAKDCMTEISARYSLIYISHVNPTKLDSSSEEISFPFICKNFMSLTNDFAINVEFSGLISTKLLSKDTWSHNDYIRTPRTSSNIDAISSICFCLAGFGIGSIFLPGRYCFAISKIPLPECLVLL